MEYKFEVYLESANALGLHVCIDPLHTLLPDGCLPSRIVATAIGIEIFMCDCMSSYGSQSESTLGADSSRT